MRILVTGGAGFIGSHVAAHLAAGGNEVHIADRFSYAGKWRNVAGLEVRVWPGDLRDGEYCAKLAAAGFEGVVHTAANTHVDRSIADPCGFTLDNVLATNRLLEAVERSGQRPWRILLYSSDEVYGPTPPGQRFDEAAPFAPSNAYSASKVGVEGLATAYFVTHKLPVVVVRPCNTYGRRQHPEKAVPRFTLQALAGQPLTVHNDGHGARDWLHTSDHAAAVATLLFDSQPGEAYNLAAGDEHEDEALARRICEMTNSHSEISYIAGRPGHDRRYWMDGSKLRRLGWQPRMTFEDGLRDEIEWVRANADWWQDDSLAADVAKRLIVA